ncbi:hypothetical protein H9Q09_11790 [Aurantimonas sp. DM33-3]|uniref:hypothetical protein n=1 Tax=Aurantimonas sp. DM33-3 TaxID=2766955 RepID=UPI001652868E|nr:hypothetical protein [Aurantimonas sp. DM33-3]MBC6716889.1 hypothetical protein [Aurantimonas sp. DM33-3]
MTRAHAKTRRLIRAGLSYSGTLRLVLRDLWSLLRRPLPALVGRRRDIMRAESLRVTWMPYYVREIEHWVLECQDEPGVFERGLALTTTLFRSDAAFWIDIGKGGMVGLDRLGEIVRGERASA